MKFLVKETELRSIPSDQKEQLLADEALHVWNLYQKGIIREIYFTAETHEAVIIFEGNQKDEIIKITNDFPLVKNGYIKFEITELNPYTGFKRLFNE